MQPRAVLALGAIAFHAYLRLLVKQGRIPSAAPYPFSHGAEFKLPGDLPHLFASYHPSQQNTQTGRLTPAMFAAVLRRIRQVVGAGQGVSTDILEAGARAYVRALSNAIRRRTVAAEAEAAMAAEPEAVPAP